MPSNIVALGVSNITVINIMKVNTSTRLTTSPYVGGKV